MQKAFVHKAKHNRKHEDDVIPTNKLILKGLNHI